MLKIEPTNDKELLNRLAREACDAPFLGDVGFVLYYRDTPVGVARLTITPACSHIIAVAVVPAVRGQGFGDFFTRSLLNNLTMVSETVTVDYADTYYLKFGFRQCGTQMKINSKDIVFPSKCKESES